MPGVQLSTRACEGHVVVALRGDLDIIGAADAGAAITALVAPGRCLIIDMSALDFIDCGSVGALLRVEWLAWSAAVALAVAGVYQFTPLKARCLRHCRSPLGFLLHFGNFRGRLRDVRVGIYHGGYCVGCCWSLMLVLVAVGVTNMAWMVALTAVVFAEKTWRSGQAFGYAAGALMIIAALLLPWLPPVQTALLS